MCRGPGGVGQGWGARRPSLSLSATHDIECIEHDTCACTQVEFTHSYTHFKRNACQVDVASPLGGVGPTDPQVRLDCLPDPAAYGV